MEILGIDVGGSGIKGAIVDTESGKLISDRIRIETPKPSTPGAVADVIRDIKELKKMIEANGGKVTGSISAKTNYLVAGENMGPSKLAKAEKVGTTIISEDEFLAMVE